MNDQVNLRLLNEANGLLLLLSANQHVSDFETEIDYHGTKAAMEEIRKRLDAVIHSYINAGHGSFMGLDESAEIVRSWRQCDSCNATE